MDHRCSFANRIRQGCVVVAIQVLATASTLTWAAPNDSDCRVEVGRVVSRQGTVEVRHGAGAWVAAKRESVLCDGDAVRTGRHARAALFIRPENIVRLDQNTAVNLRVNDAETLVEFFTNEQRVSAGPDCGAAYFVSRFPRRFKVRTHYVNAEIEGTEFLVRDQCSRSLVAVYEGRVQVAPRDGGDILSLRPGEVAAAGIGISGAIRLDVDAADQVQWVIYHPRSNAGSPDTVSAQDCDTAHAPSVCEATKVDEALASGDLPGANAAIERIGRRPSGQSANLAFRALLLLQGIDASRLDASAVVRNTGDAKATARTRRTEALGLAHQATSADPRDPRAWLALSYVLQATLDLDGALAAARTSANLRPDAFHLARVAEVLLARGNISDALAIATTATRLDPNEPRAHQMVGSAELARRNARLAVGDFKRAVELDDQDPYSRMGLGLSRIRAGELIAGRTDLEIATALAPRNSVARSYLGQAYFEESGRTRLGLAGEQFDLAKSLDPLDPTPWFLEGVRRQALNEPAEALREHRESIERNDNRAIYRSPELLNQDLAGRIGQRGNTYESLGLSSLAAQEAAAAIEADPADDAAHRSLSRSLSYAPRQEVSRVSEAFAARLLQRSAALPTDTRTTTTNLGLAPGSEPLFAGLGAGGGMLERDGFRGFIGGLAGSRGTASGEATVFGQSGRFSMQTGVFGYRSDGFRPNSDLAHRIGSALIQYALTDAVDVQAEIRGDHSNQGEVAQAFRADGPTDQSRLEASQSLLRLGMRAELGSKSLLLATVSSTRRNTSLNTTFPGLQLFERIDSAGMQVDVQHVFRADTWSVVSGANHADISNKRLTVFEFVPPPCLFGDCMSRGNDDLYQTALYGYGIWAPNRNISITTGVSLDRFHEKNYIEKSRFDPKLGLRWKLTPTFTLRAAVFRTMRRGMVANATLEPTQIAGFGQFYDEYNGTVTLNRSIGFDYAFGADSTLLADFTHRKFDSPKVIGEGITTRDGVDETIARLAVSTGVGRNTIVGIESVMDRYTRRDSGDGSWVPTLVNTGAVTPSIRWFHPFGWFSIGSVNVVRQEVRRIQDHPYGPGGVSNFQTVDFSVGWRKPGTASFISVDARNVLDHRFLYLDDSFRASQPRADIVRFSPVRAIWIRAGFEF